MAKINFIIRKIVIYFIKVYRYLISPILGDCCRFYPSCSVYACDAVKNHGVIKGSFMVLKRIACCHPWHPGGFDPVPPTESKNLFLNNQLWN